MEAVMLGLEWIANAIIIAGLFAIGRKQRIAFLLSFAGEAMWTGLSLMRCHYSLAAICAVFCVLAVRNWFLWSDALIRKKE